MNILQLKTCDEILNAYNVLKDTFPDLSQRVNINEYFKKISTNGNTYVINENNQTCAIACIYINDFTSKTSYITLIGVHKDCRRHGYAQILLDYCISESKNSGMNFIKLEVNKNNYPAIKLYRKNNFEVVDDTSQSSYYMIKEL